MFFAVIPDQTEAFTVGYAASDVSVYIGSLDDEFDHHRLPERTTATHTGDNLAAISGQTTPIPGGGQTIYGR